MARRSHPTHTPLQEKILMALADLAGTKQIRIVQNLIEEGIKKIPERDKETYILHYNNMSQEQKRATEK